MPHIHIWHFPVALSDAAQSIMVQDITAAVTRALECESGAVSIVREHVCAADWKEHIYNAKITSNTHNLIKSPTY